MKTLHLSIIVGFAIGLLILGNASVFGFMIHDLNYENSQYNNRTMPVVGNQMRLFYQVVNYTPQSQGYDVIISIINLDEARQVYHTTHNYRINSNEFEDVIWNFTPETEGLYSVDVIENSGKDVKYIFAVTKDDYFRHAASANTTLLDGKSPMQQFRLGIDPKEIKCREDLYLALRPTSLPVCISLETLKVMKQRNLVISDAIDYDRIGYVTSENQFKKMLDEKNIKYTPDNFLLITGFILESLPPTTEYCGYVQDDNKENHWFSSSYHYDNLTSYKLFNQNPNPCQPSTVSCFCDLQTKLAEKNPVMSYFTKSEEESVGKYISEYLNETKIANVSNQFVVGKYNLESNTADIHYCGTFTGGAGLKDFDGYIKNGKVVDFSLATEKPKLCAISNNSQIFTFDKSSIVPDSFGVK